MSGGSVRPGSFPLDLDAADADPKLLEVGGEGASARVRRLVPLPRRTRRRRCRRPRPGAPARRALNAPPAAAQPGRPLARPQVLSAAEAGALPPGALCLATGPCYSSSAFGFWAPAPGQAHPFVLVAPQDKVRRSSFVRCPDQSGRSGAAAGAAAGLPFAACGPVHSIDR